MINQSTEVTLTHSGLLSVNGQPYVSVRFERGMDFAEGCIPEAKIIKSSGFNSEEIQNLEQYLSHSTRDLMIRAKDISGIKHWF